MSRQFTIALVILLAALNPLANNIYLPALAIMRREFAVSPGEIQYTLSAFLGGAAAGQLFFGPLSDRLGRRPVLFLGLGLFVLVSVAAVFAESISSLVLYRLVQGITGAASTVIARAIIRDCFPLQEARRVITLFGMAIGISPMAAPLIGGYLTTWVSWRATLAVLAAYGLLLLVLVFLRYHETRPASTAGFRLRAYPQLLADRRFVVPALSLCSFHGALFAWVATAGLLLPAMTGLPASAVGWMLTLTVLGYIGGSFAAGRIAAYLSGNAMIILGASCTTSAGIVLTTSASPEGSIILVLGGAMLSAFGAGIGMGQAMVAAIDPFPERAGTASALAGGMQFATAGLGGLLAGWVYDGSALPLGMVIAAFGSISLLAALYDRHDHLREIRGS